MSQQINLFNPIFLKQKKYFSAVTMMQGLALILLGSGLISAYASMQLSQLRSEAKAVTTQLEAARTQLTTLDQVHAARTKDSSLEAQVRRLEVEVAALQRVAGTLSGGDAGHTAGYSDYMHAFSRQIIDGVWLTSFSIVGAGSEITISGRALQPELVPAYLNRLRNEATMRGKAFGVFEMHADVPLADGSSEQNPFVVFNLRSTGIAVAGNAPAGAGAR